MRILRLVRKDLKSVFLDAKVIAVLVLMPVILTSILGFALRASFERSVTLAPFEIAVVPGREEEDMGRAVLDSLRASPLGAVLSDEQKRALADAADSIDPDELFFEEFLGEPQIQAMMQVRVLEQNDAMQGLRDNRFAAVVVLPERFAVDTALNLTSPFRNPIEIQVVQNPNMIYSAGVVTQLMQGYAAQLSSLSVAKNVLLQELGRHMTLDESMGRIDAAMDQLGGEQSRTDIENLAVTGNEWIDSMSYYAMSMLTLFLLFAAGQGSTLLLRERKAHTLERLVLAGYGQGQILFAKALCVFAVALMQMAIMMGYTRLVFDVRWGEPLQLAALSILCAMAVAAMGSLFAVATLRLGSYTLTTVLESVVFQIFGLLGGAYLPVAVLPPFLRRLSDLPLNGVALSAFTKTMLGGGWPQVGRELLLLGLNVLVFAGLSVLLMEKGGLSHEKHSQTGDEAAA